MRDRFGRRNAEAELTEAEERVLAAITEPVVVASPDNIIVFANSATCRMLGWGAAAELMGKPVTAIVPERLRHAHRTSLSNYAASVRARRFGEPLRLAALRADGTEVDVELVLSELALESGRGAVLATFRDARAKVELERQSNVSGRLLQVLAERLGHRDAVSRLLGTIGDAMRWDAAGLWVVDADVCQLRCEGFWPESAGLERFRTASLGGLLPAGVDLPGRVWETGESVWITDLVSDPSVVRARLAAEHGLVTGYAFPIVTRSRFVGVVELLARERRQPDTGLLATTAAIAEVVGDFLERNQRDEDRQQLLDELSTERSRLDAVLRQMPAGVLIADASGDRILQGNDVASQLLGAPTVEEGDPQEPGQRLRLLHFTIVDHRGRVYDNRALPIARAARTGETMREELDVRRRDGANGVVTMTASPVFDRHGRVVSAVAVVHDVTERRMAERRYRYLASATELLSSSLDYTATLERLARLALPEVADSCVVDIVGRDGSPERVVVAFADPQKEELGRASLVHFPPDLTKNEGVPKVLRTGAPVLYRTLTDESLAAIARNDEHFALMKEIGFRSTMMVPLAAHGHVFGALTFSSVTPGRELGEDDLDLAVELATRAGVAVANARLYERERDTAAILQRSLLPPSLPTAANLDMAARFHPGREGIVVGGDFYDVFRVDGGSWAFVIGDVCGTGAEAAALAVHVRHAVRARAPGRAPREVLASVNESLLAQLGDQRFCTAVYGTLEPSGDGFVATIAGAGHPSPALVSRSGSVELVPCTGSLLGVFERVEFGQVERALGPGDGLVLYTDGVTEARNGTKWFGDEGVTHALCSAPLETARDIADHLLGEALRFGGMTSADDIAVLVVKVPEGAA